MARSLNKKYFGNRNIGTTVDTDDGIGGLGVASVTVAGTFSGFTGATTTVTFSAPQLPTGVTATGTAVIDGGGAVTGITITEKGSGYITAPTVTIADSDVGAETATGTLTAVLTVDTGDVGSGTNQENAIVVYAKTTSGGTSKVGDIIRQVGARRFRVRTADGIATCALKNSAVSAEGEMTITAFDSDGDTYFVTKIGGHRVTVTRGTGTQFSSDSTVPWTLGAPVANVSLQLANA